MSRDALWNERGVVGVTQRPDGVRAYDAALRSADMAPPLALAVGTARPMIAFLHQSAPKSCRGTVAAWHGRDCAGDRLAKISELIHKRNQRRNASYLFTLRGAFLPYRIFCRSRSEQDTHL